MKKNNKGEMIGRMDREVTIQRLSLTPTAYGDNTQTWATLATVWAAVNYPVTHSGEAITDGLNISAQRVEFTVRAQFDSAPTVKDRVLYGSSVYDIVSISELGRNDYLKLITERHA